MSTTRISEITDIRSKILNAHSAAAASPPALRCRSVTADALIDRLWLPDRRSVWLKVIVQSLPLCVDGDVKLVSCPSIETVYWVLAPDRLRYAAVPNK